MWKGRVTLWATLLLHFLVSPMSIMMTREVVGTGFHRELRTTLLEYVVVQGCEPRNLVLLENLPPELYLDLNELDGLGISSALLSPTGHHSIDVERPAASSEPHSVAIYIENTPMAVEIPLHLRYQSPSHKKTAQAILLPPLLCAKCEKLATNGAADKSSSCDALGSGWLPVQLGVSGPADLKSSDPLGSVIVNRLGIHKNGSVVLTVPVGQLSHALLISFATFLTTVLAAVGTAVITLRKRAQY